MNINHYTYRVTWSAEDNEHVGLCTEFPSLSWLAATPEKALSGIRRVVGELVAEMASCGEHIPEALAEKNSAAALRISWSVIGGMKVKYRSSENR
jgi:predicted RNase H-like HicB family nuclease